MSAERSRQAAGQRTGGQFKAEQHTESEVELGAGSTATPPPGLSLQTDAPLGNIGFTRRDWSLNQLMSEINAGQVDLSPPYQRESVWTYEQKAKLIRSFLDGTPIPSVVMNDRLAASNYSLPPDEPQKVVIDGKQRMETFSDFFNDRLSVPASWFDSEDVLSTTQTSDGPYVSMSQLGLGRARNLGNRPLQFSEAALKTLDEEKELYLTLNTGGTQHTEEELDRAR